VACWRVLKKGTEETKKAKRGREVESEKVGGVAGAEGAKRELGGRRARVGGGRGKEGALGEEDREKSFAKGRMSVRGGGGASGFVIARRGKGRLVEMEAYGNAGALGVRMSDLRVGPVKNEIV